MKRGLWRGYDFTFMCVLMVTVMIWVTSIDWKWLSIIRDDSALTLLLHGICIRCDEIITGVTYPAQRGLCVLGILLGEMCCMQLPISYSTAYAAMKSYPVSDKSRGGSYKGYYPGEPHPSKLLPMPCCNFLPGICCSVALTRLLYILSRSGGGGRNTCVWL